MTATGGCSCFHRRISLWKPRTNRCWGWVVYLDGYEAAPVLLMKGVSPYSNNFTGELVGIQIFIRFGSKLYRQIVGIPMGTNCAPLVADLFLFCYERDFMLSLSDNNQTDIIEAFNSTSRYLDNLLNIDNPYFE